MIPEGFLVVVAETMGEEERKLEIKGGKQGKWKCPVCSNGLICGLYAIVDFHSLLIFLVKFEVLVRGQLL